MKNFKKEYMISWVDSYFRNNFNGRRASKELKPHLSIESCQMDFNRMINNKFVLDLIEEKQEKIRREEDIQLSYVVRNLVKIVDDIEKEGNMYQEGKLVARKDRKTQLSALTQLSKIAGFETKKLETTIRTDFNLKDLLDFE